MTSTSVDPAADLLRERAAHYAAQAALFLRDQALSTASHDLRSPLNAMHSWAYVLERQLANADPNLQRALAGIRTGIDQQVALIDDVLDAPRAETRTLALEPRPFALRALLDDTLALVRATLADARQVPLDATLPDDGAPSLSADRERIAQALWTMLTTAVETSAAGSRVTFECARDGARFTARAACTVNAAALADPAQPHAFEAFARREMLRERDAKRVAWTLALCQRIALAHGGTFSHTAFIDGAAATLTFSVPCEAPV
ncbi:sensor histidine kinase [Burkholderia seminalis]|uniref:sensor histidine kinase n=1 Tax=Burkholderia seminalis TaxID=488731 RepID=UPI00264FFCA7|nr:HAMP domain-containing sensor histidine kinase [Burkholderia seminalis]MDN7585547.1 HAMP domain-containing sensor histidine kinase [Burkholderia seminalis]